METQRVVVEGGGFWNHDGGILWNQDVVYIYTSLCMYYIYI